ncbi:hypothetical protein GCM10010994_18740 [Chelatococcus reniformis]|uniref:DUF3606 domain-containing protein n=1 Tax=Chelatococcus reniformis TaxID=1494448 RepID=A0A916XCF2_9HYPH|nr:hypothetical protein GCM10010994_18740 [Chelatococcus reniformis]
MPENKTPQAAADRGAAAMGAHHFARVHGISKDKALRLLQRLGNNPEKLKAAAEKLRR